MLGTAGTTGKVFMFGTEDCARPILTLQRSTVTIRSLVQHVLLGLVRAARAAGNLGPDASLQVWILTL
jgi:hypothetical protein